MKLAESVYYRNSAINKSAPQIMRPHNINPGHMFIIRVHNIDALHGMTMFLAVNKYKSSHYIHCGYQAIFTSQSGKAAFFANFQ